MTTTLIVLAHPEGRSFNAHWASKTQEACLNAGHTVLMTDLVGQSFDPVEAARHYPDHKADAVFDPLKAQQQASSRNVLPVDVRSEISKLRQADRVILHFPIWWFAPPAVLKGWLDRVFAHGETHDTDNRFDRGQFKGREVLFCVTTGSRAAESAHNGKEGDIQMLLWPLAYALRYVGYSVLVPEIVHGVHGYHRGDRLTDLQTRLRAAADGQARLIENWDSRPELPFNADDDFDAEGRLKGDRPSYTPFIRHTP